MLVDLKAHRCPTAQVLMNRILLQFSKMDASELVICTIEPSMQRNIEARIAGQDLAMRVSDVSSRPLSNEDLTFWGEEFDEDDYGDVCLVTKITIRKSQKSGENCRSCEPVLESTQESNHDYD